MEFGNISGNDTHCIHIKSGIGLVKHSQFRLQDTHLKNFTLLPFATGETVIQITVSTGRIHGKPLHTGLQKTLKRKQALLLPGNGRLCRTDEIFCRNPRNRNRILKR